jgi:hypothetical protein
MRIASTLAAVAVLACSGLANAAPTYTIVDMGTIRPTDSAVQGFRISPGGTATGRSIGTITRAFRWTTSTPMDSLPNLTSPARNFGVGNGANDVGEIVGNGATTLSGSNPLPLIWQGSVVSQLPLPAGQTLGRANDINDSHVAVGSVNSGSNEVGATYAGGVGTVITTLTPAGCFLRTAFGINNAGLIVGFGIDPANAARNVGFVYNSVTNTATEVGALPGMNGAIAFDVSEDGRVVGTSSLNQGAGMPFIWDSVNGIQPIPLPPGTSSAIARGVNSNGWVVGIGSSAFAIPFLFDGVSTYRLQDLLPPGSGWDISTNTSSSALGISENGTIVGTGIHNGQTHAYAMILQQVTAVALQSFDAIGRLDGIALRWSFSSSSDWTSVRIESAPSNTGPWQSVDSAIATEVSAMSALDTDVAPGETRFYRLQVTDRGSVSSAFGLVSATRGVASGVSLSAPSPNPASRGASMMFRVGSAQEVSLSVLDVRGRLVRNLYRGLAPSGDHVQSWDGKTDRGVAAAPGVYYIRLHTIEGDHSQRLVLVQ